MTARTALSAPVLVLAHLLLAAPVAAQAVDARDPIVEKADIRVSFTMPTRCAVTMTVELQAGSGGSVDHRLLLYEGTRVDRVEASGNGVAFGRPTALGRTLSLRAGVAGAGRHSYDLAYEIEQPGRWAERCPLWLPIAPTPGVRNVVHIAVLIPAGLRPLDGSFPAFAWTRDGTGTADLPELPSVVRVTTTAPGREPHWLSAFSLQRLVDAAAVAILVLASATWAWSGRRR